MNLPPEFTFRIYGHKEIGSPIEIAEVRAGHVDAALTRWSEIHNKEYRTWHDVTVYKSGNALRVYHHDVGLKIPPTYGPAKHYERIVAGANDDPLPALPAPLAGPPPAAAAPPERNKYMYKMIVGGITVREA